MRNALRVVAGCACILAPALMVSEIHSPVRAVAAFVLFGLAPGVAALPLLAERSAPVELSLVVATSLAASVMVAQSMLWLHLWSPTGATCVMAVICLVAIVYPVMRPRLS
jgi:hypothetical protein